MHTYNEDIFGSVRVAGVRARRRPAEVIRLVVVNHVADPLRGLDHLYAPDWVLPAVVIVVTLLLVLDWLLYWLFVGHSQFLGGSHSSYCPYVLTGMAARRVLFE